MYAALATRLGEASINSCYGREKMVALQTPRDNDAVFAGAGQRAKSSLQVLSHNPSETDLSFMHMKLVEECRSKANYVVWQVGLISRYFTRTTTDTPAHARLRRGPCDRPGSYLFGYGIQSHLHLVNLMVLKSQSPNARESCHDAFVDLSQRENTTAIFVTEGPAEER